jgi:hypothetical protein
VSGFLDWFTGEPTAPEWLSQLLSPGAPSAAHSVEPPFINGYSMLGQALRSGLYGLATEANRPGRFAGDLGAGLAGASEARRRQKIAEVTLRRFIQPAAERGPALDEISPSSISAGVRPDTTAGAMADRESSQDDPILTGPSNAVATMTSIVRKNAPAWLKLADGRIERVDPAAAADWLRQYAPGG